MKTAYKIFAMLVATLVAQQAWAQIPSDSLRVVSNNAFKVGEKLSYLMHYGFLNAGEATLEVKNTEKTILGRKLIKVVGEGHSVGSFNWFYKVDDYYETTLDSLGVFPWVFIRRVDEGGYTIKQDYVFHQHKNKVNLGEHKGEQQGEKEMPNYIQDMLSAFYYARTIPMKNLKKGDIITVPTVVDGEIFDLKIKFVGKKSTKVEAGKFNCMVFNPVVQKGRIFKAEDDLEVYISDDENKIPILIKAKVLVGSIKMELTNYTGLANTLAKIK